VAHLFDLPTYLIGGALLLAAAEWYRRRRKRRRARRVEDVSEQYVSDKS
jgi:hypothetical protein